MKFISIALPLAALLFVAASSSGYAQNPKVTRTDKGWFEATTETVLRAGPDAVFSKEHVHLAACSFALRLLNEGALPYIGGQVSKQEDSETQYWCFISALDVTVEVYWNRASSKSDVLPDGRLVLRVASPSSKQGAIDRSERIHMLFYQQIESIKALFAHGKKVWAEKIIE